MENTSINDNGLFKVTKLLSKKRNFKITTLHHEIYKKISNTVIWEPEFRVRDFVTNKKREFAPHRYDVTSKHTKYGISDKKQLRQHENLNKYVRNEHLKTPVQRKCMGSPKGTPSKRTMKGYTPRRIYQNVQYHPVPAQTMNNQIPQHQSLHPNVYYRPPNQNFQPMASTIMLPPQQFQQQMNGQQSIQQTIHNR